VVDDPRVFAVHADSGFKDLLQLAAYAKANPGAVSVGTPGVGAPGHLAILMFAKLAGTNVNHVPFKGAGDVRARRLLADRSSSERLASANPFSH